ncbi:MAG: bifunctional enoyl-CoA hydratase/phosphate acetyltransferase [Actinomycetota bacterium]
MPLAHANAQDLVERARQLGPVPTAVAAAGSPLALEGARLAADEGLIEPFLVGDVDAITESARSIDWDLGEVWVVPAASDRDAARIAVGLARDGVCGAVMKGHLHTDVLMLAALDKTRGLRAGRRFTHAFHLTVPGRGPLLLSDAAVNVHPNVETKVDIVRNLVDLAHATGIAEPKVAILSSTEEVSERIRSSVDAAEVTARCAGIDGALVFGPLAFDVAVSEEAARIKGVRHPVAGHADALVVPDIDAGNALFKMMVHFMGALAAGVVLGGLVPICLTSRADSPAARLTSAALARLMAPTNQVVPERQRHDISVPPAPH